MAVDKKAIGLSSVHIGMCTMTTVSVARPIIYLSILFLNILTLLACTQSVDNLFAIR